MIVRNSNASQTREVVNRPEDPLISIVMPSYNQARFIREAMDSVLEQDYSRKELIVIDGGSEDGTVDILKDYEPHLAYWESQPDRGQSHALNKGFARAQGDWLGWMNADDRYKAGSFRALMAAVDSRVQVVFGDHETISEAGEVLEWVPAFDFNLNHFIYEGFHLNAQSMLWRSSLMKQYGHFPENLHRTMDYDLIVRLGQIAGNQGFRRINKTIGQFRRHDLQKTRRWEQKEVFGLDQSVYEEHLKIAKARGFPRKYAASGRLVRRFFRLRRLAWYLRRGGLSYTCGKMGLAPRPDRVRTAS